MWTEEEIATIDQEDSLFISIPNSEGVLHKPTYIWGVSAGGDFYARGASGVESKWYQAALISKRAHITIGNVDKEVILEFPDDPTTKTIVDQAYREKYNSYLDLMTSDSVAAATVKMIPVH